MCKFNSVTNVNAHVCVAVASRQLLLEGVIDLCQEDCAGVPLGAAALDECGTCDTDPLNDCRAQDCTSSIRAVQDVTQPLLPFFAFAVRLISAEPSLVDNECAMRCVDTIMQPRVSHRLYNGLPVVFNEYRARPFTNWPCSSRLCLL